VNRRPLPGEFELIARYFAPLAATAPGALSLTDDVAVLALDANEELVLKTDAVVAGVHFLPDDPPDLIARKLLRVNLSDLAGKGARPLGYLLACAFPADLDAAWLAAFVAGLAADQAEFAIPLLGGDTTSTPGPLTLAATVLGAGAAGRTPRRAGARPGDAVLVSGTLGDGALGLDVQRDKLPTVDAAGRAYLIDRYRLPRPRLDLGRALVAAGIVHASMDVSDGLLADLGHVVRQSAVGARIDWPRVPLSPAVAGVVAARPDLRERVLAGGDDYELLLTVAADRVPEALTIGGRIGVPLTEIGGIVAGDGVEVLDEQGAPLPVGRRGFQHF
jgi:thiamine-monophosphate kinase